MKDYDDDEDMSDIDDPDLLAERSSSSEAPVPVTQEEAGPPADPESYGAPDAPTTIAEALNQRLQKYKSEELKAKEGGNGSKARRMGRICKQYEDAIRMNKAGRPIPRGDLPEPPGFGPIPVSDAPHAGASQGSQPKSAAASVPAAASASAATVASKNPEPPAAAS